MEPDEHSEKRSWYTKFLPSWPFTFLGFIGLMRQMRQFPPYSQLTAAELAAAGMLRHDLLGDTAQMLRLLQAAERTPPVEADAEQVGLSGTTNATVDGELRTLFRNSSKARAEATLAFSGGGMMRRIRAVLPRRRHRPRRTQHRP